jgi:hypothetical protein
MKKKTGCHTYRIQLSNSDQVVWVDEEDYEELSKYNWYMDHKGYALRKLPRNGGPSRAVRMHREILGAKEGEIVDHINRHKLDNRKSNLRIVTPSQSCMNQGLRKDNPHGYRGVTFRKEKKSNPWRAWLTIEGRRVELGHYNTAEEAALAYNEAAKKYFQEYAVLNEIRTE